jgi:hypothetical protein
MVTEYWCRFHTCAHPSMPLADICTDGDRPDDPSCSERFRKVVLPAVRGAAWVSPAGDRAIVLTNSDEIERSAAVPLPRSWAAAFSSAQLCRVGVPDPAASGECREVAVVDGFANVVSLPPFSAFHLRFGSDVASSRGAGDPGRTWVVSSRRVRSDAEPP